MKKSLDFLGFSKYYVTDTGELWRQSYVSNNGLYQRGCRLDGTKDARGYRSYRLMGDDGRPHLWKLHRLVANAFVRELQEGQSVLFRNGDKTDCSAANLLIVSEQILKTAVTRLNRPKNRTRETLESPGLQYRISKQAYDSLDALSGGIGREGPHKASYTVRELIKQARETQWRPVGQKRELTEKIVLTMPRELIKWLKSFRKGHGPLRDQALDFLLVQFVAELQKQEDDLK